MTSGSVGRVGGVREGMGVGNGVSFFLCVSFVVVLV